MNQQQMIEAHITALRGLYECIAEVAKSMGGIVRERVSGFRRNVDVPFPRRENILTLEVEMPDSFHVELAPSNTLGGGNVVSVRARRTHYGGLKNDWTSTFVHGVWRMGQNPLSDEDIRRCLTPEGPRPIAY